MSMFQSHILVMIAVLTVNCRLGYGADVSVTPPAPESTTPEQKIAPAQLLSDAARRVLNLVKNTDYSHRTAIDEVSGSFVTDCSGLLTWLLRKNLPAHLAAIPIKRGTTRPLAADFQEAFAAGVAGWQRILHVQELHSGDVVAWSYINPQPGKSTGHVVIIDGDPVSDGEGIYSIAVIDSTSAPHDDDTRIDTDGVGRGNISVRVDSEGKLVAVRVNAKSTFRKQIFASARPVGP